MIASAMPRSKSWHAKFPSILAYFTAPCVEAILWTVTIKKHFTWIRNNVTVQISGSLLSSSSSLKFYQNFRQLQLFLKIRIQRKRVWKLDRFPSTGFMLVELALPTRWMSRHTGRVHGAISVLSIKPTVRVSLLFLFRCKISHEILWNLWNYLWNNKFIKLARRAKPLRSLKHW